MAAKKKRKGHGSQPVRGFRPGKEPAHLRKRQAKAKLGSDATWAQKQAVELVADRSPQEVQAMLSRWTTGLLVLVLVLALSGAFLYGWSVWAGVAVHLMAAAALLLWFRLFRQRRQLVEMAETFGKR